MRSFVVARTSPCLVTSRERLGITGELTYRVPSLTVPGTSETLTPETASRYEGVRASSSMRAKLVSPDFACDGGECLLCRIDLRSARRHARWRSNWRRRAYVSMSVNELNQRLDERFALLTGGSRAALPRHRTLRSLIDWSFDLLTSSEQPCSHGCRSLRVDGLGNSGAGLHRKWH